MLVVSTSTYLLWREMVLSVETTTSCRCYCTLPVLFLPLKIQVFLGGFPRSLMVSFACNMLIERLNQKVGRTFFDIHRNELKISCFILLNRYIHTFMFFKTANFYVYLLLGMLILLYNFFIFSRVDSFFVCKLSTNPLKWRMSKRKTAIY